MMMESLSSIMEGHQTTGITSSSRMQCHQAVAAVYEASMLCSPFGMASPYEQLLLSAWVRKGEAPRRCMHIKRLRRPSYESFFVILCSPRCDGTFRSVSTLFILKCTTA